jgi:uncharacterized protein YegP (UPF0339 family)
LLIVIVADSSDRAAIVRYYEQHGCHHESEVFSMWKFEVYRDAAGEWRWRLKAANGRIVADSGEGYASDHNARRAAENARSSIGGARID